MLEGIPVLLALGAGSASTVNPCGFAMLPAFVAFFLGEAGDSRLPARLVRAGLVAGLVTIGFVAVFGVIGAVISATTRSIVRYVPVVSIGVGVVLIAAGTAGLAGRPVSLVLRPVKRVDGAANRSMVAYGVAYGLASLACTLPIFLVVVGAALATAGFVSSLLAFVVYAAGMGFVLLGVSLATALGKSALITWFRRVVPYVERASHVGLLFAGGYLVYREIAFLRFAGWF